MVRQCSTPICTLLYAVSVLGLIQPAGAGVQYTITDLGASTKWVSQINEAGQVTGYAVVADGTYQAFVWSAGQMTMLGRLAGDGHGFALNDQGQVVGSAYADAGYTDSRAVLWQNGTIQDLNVPGGPRTGALGINNAGQITVNSQTSAYLWENGALRDLGFEHAGAINDVGQVIGRRNTGEVYAYTPVYHAVAWDSGSVRDLGTLGGRFSLPYAINQAGLIVGAASLPGDPATGPSTACYWDNAGIHQIPIVSTVSLALGVNDLGQVVGSYGIGDTTHAFLYSGGIAADLNDLIDPSSGWLLYAGQDINNRGQIIGKGLIQGQSRYYMLTPVPLPATLVLLLPGLLWMRRRGHSRR